MARFNDLGELHKMAVDAGKPEAVLRIVRESMEKARKKCSPQDSPQGGGSGEKFVLPVTTLRDVASSSEKKTSYVAYPDLKEGELGLLVGPAKFAGKTRFTLGQIQAIRSGDLFLGEATKKVKVVYLTEQGNNFGTAIKDAGLDVEDDGVLVVQQRDVFNMHWEDLAEKTLGLCLQFEAKALIVDTFAAFANIKGQEENEAGTIIGRLRPLKKAAQTHDIAVRWSITRAATVGYAVQAPSTGRWTSSTY